MLSLTLSAFNLKAVKEHLGTGWFENWAQVVCEQSRYDAMLSHAEHGNSFVRTLNITAVKCVQKYSLLARDAGWGRH